MDLDCPIERAVGYRSNAQIARVVTEEWCARQMYCPACTANSIAASPNNCPGVDFTCPECAVVFQLKSRKHPLANRVVDAGYDAMIRAIRSDQVPNLFLLQYSSHWTVLNLIVIPSFFVSESAIEKRKPLSARARRAGWVGCNILLDGIPPDGRIPVIANGFALPPSDVRGAYRRARPLSTLKPQVRGWTLDVLNAVRKLNSQQFVLGQVYASEKYFEANHPHNKNIRPKIRQQLQVLRDLGYLEFEGAGRYRVSN